MTLFSKEVTSNRFFIFFIIACVGFIIYFPSIHFGYTELDDTILIKEHASFNKDPKNLFRSFTRGIFSEEKDAYYRPVLLQSFIFNYLLSKEKLQSYHVINIILHILCCILVFKFLIVCKIKEQFAFILTLFFTIHPMLVQAVSWIPGRNDTILMLFVLLHLLSLKLAFEKQSWTWFAFSFLAVLLAFFTKETGLFVMFAGFIWAWYFLPLPDKKQAAIYLSGAYLACLFIWFVFRINASVDSTHLSIGEMTIGIIPRSILLIQYLGKWFIPYNLSVFPTIQETHNWSGIFILVLLSALLWIGRKHISPIAIFGLGWFVLFLLPTLILPSSLNEQSFEHRMYLPSLGLLLALGASPLFTGGKKHYATWIGLVIIAVFSFLNFRHQQHFKNPITFWTQAIESSPGSAYAQMMFATRISKTDPELGLAHMKKAYQLNPKEKYVNYHLGKFYLEKDSLSLAGKMLYEELNYSDYYDTYFQLARYEFIQKNLTKSIEHMEKYLSKKNDDMPALQNYMLMLRDTNQKDRALKKIAEFEKVGIIVPAEIKNLFK